MFGWTAATQYRLEWLLQLSGFALQTSAWEPRTCTGTPSLTLSHKCPSHITCAQVLMCYAAQASAGCKGSRKMQFVSWYSCAACSQSLSQYWVSVHISTEYMCEPSLACMESFHMMFMKCSWAVWYACAGLCALVDIKVGLRDTACTRCASMLYSTTWGLYTSAYFQQGALAGVISMQHQLLSGTGLERSASATCCPAAGKPHALQHGTPIGGHVVPCSSLFISMHNSM